MGEFATFLTDKEYKLISIVLFLKGDAKKFGQHFINVFQMLKTLLVKV